MASATDTPRSVDIEFLFEALNYATTPVTINIALLGTAKDAKPNTLAKRISGIAKRYNLNITTTTKGEVNSPVTPSKPRAIAAKPPASRKRKVAAKVKKHSDEEDDEVEMNGKRSDEEAEHGGKKRKTSNVDMGHEDEAAYIDIVGEDVAGKDVAEELA